MRENIQRDGTDIKCRYFVTLKQRNIQTKFHAVGDIKGQVTNDFSVTIKTELFTESEADFCEH